MEKGYLEYIEGENEKALVIPEETTTAAHIKAFKDWNQGAKKVLHWKSLSIQDSMIDHIQNAMSQKEAWDIWV